MLRSGIGVVLAGVCLVVALCLSSAPRGTQLAYDGPYDTPPVTWYFNAQGSQVSALAMGMTITRLFLIPLLLRAPRSVRRCIQARRMP